MKKKIIFFFSLQRKRTTTMSLGLSVVDLKQNHKKKETFSKKKGKNFSLCDFSFPYSLFPAFFSCPHSIQCPSIHSYTRKSITKRRHGLFHLTQSIQMEWDLLGRWQSFWSFSNKKNGIFTLSCQPYSPKQII